MVKEFCGQRNYFGQSKPGKTALDERLIEEAIWMRAMRQKSFALPKLTAATDKEEIDEAYRFLWRPSFFSPPTVISVFRIGDKYFYEAAQFCRATQKHRELSKAEWDKMIGFLEEARFWTLPTIGGETGLDGGHFLIEGHNSGRYHVVDRWSPLGNSLGDFGTYLLELSEFNQPVIH